MFFLSLETAWSKTCPNKEASGTLPHTHQNWLPSALTELDTNICEGNLVFQDGRPEPILFSANSQVCCKKAFSRGLRPNPLHTCWKNIYPMRSLAAIMGECKPEQLISPDRDPSCMQTLHISNAKKHWRCRPKKIKAFTLRSEFCVTTAKSPYCDICHVVCPPVHLSVCLWSLPYIWYLTQFSQLWTMFPHHKIRNQKKKKKLVFSLKEIGSCTFLCIIGSRGHEISIKRHTTKLQALNLPSGQFFKQCHRLITLWRQKSPLLVSLHCRKPPGFKEHRFLGSTAENILVHLCSVSGKLPCYGQKTHSTINLTWNQPCSTHVDFCTLVFWCRWECILCDGLLE